MVYSISSRAWFFQLAAEHGFSVSSRAWFFQLAAGHDFSVSSRAWFFQLAAGHGEEQQEKPTRQCLKTASDVCRRCRKQPQMCAQRSNTITEGCTQEYD
jgi:hypothetical protein